MRVVLKELDYIESDFEYRSEVISEADSEFIKSINEFLATHPELKEIYDLNEKHFDTEGLILTDVYGTVKHRTSGKKIGMPILYYRANTAGTVHDGDTYAMGIPPDNHPDYYYEFLDNQALMYLGTPDGDTHPMSGNWQWFYEKTTNPNITSPPRPYNDQTFILQSAGPDGLYGTTDDVFNFNTGGY